MTEEEFNAIMSEEEVAPSQERPPPQEGVARSPQDEFNDLMMEAPASGETAPQEVPSSPEEPNLVNTILGKLGLNPLSMPQYGSEPPEPLAAGAPMPAQSEAPPTRMDSTIAGVQDVATLGNAGPYRAGVDKWNQTLDQYMPDMLKGPVADFFTKSPISPLHMAGQAAGAINAAANLDRGSPIWGAEDRTAEVDEQLKEHPGYALVGQLVGSFIPGGAAAKGTQWGLNVAGKFGKPLVRRIASMFAATRPGRVVASAGAGAVEGSQYAKSKGEDEATGAVLGGLGSAAGQVGGEALGWVGKRVLGSTVKTEARQNLASLGRRASRGEDGIDAEGVLEVKPGTIMDEDTLMVDANRGVRQGISGSLRSEDNIADFWPVRTVLERRQDAQLGELAKFETYVKDQLPSGFRRVDGTTGGARAADTLAANSRAYTQALQSDFERVLNNSTVAYQPAQISDGIKQAILSNPAPDKGARTAWKMVENMIAEEGPTDLRRLANLRKAIDEEIDDALKPDAKAIDKSARRSLVLARNVVNSFLDQDPNFAPLNAKYASSASYQRAFAVGQNALKSNKNTLSPEALEEYMDSINPGDAQGFYEGIVRELIDSLGSSGGERRLVNKLTKDDQIVQKLGEVFPGKIDQIVEQANKVIDRTGVSNEVLAGSKTAEHLAAKNLLHPPGDLYDAFVAVLAGVNVTNTGKGVSQAAGLGAIKRLIKGNQSDPMYNAELNRLALAKGPQEIDKALGQMREVDEAFRLPTSLAGPDRSFAMQAGELPTTGVKGAINKLTTADIGDTFPLAFGANVPASAFNNPAGFERRESKRKTRQYQRKSKR